MNITVSLPWPSATTSPNARKHWTATAKAKAAQRATSFELTRQVLQASCIKKTDLTYAKQAHVAIVFNAPDKRRRDIDNCLSSIKAALDGISDATGIDDGLWSYEIRRGDVVAGGRVDVTITV